MNRITSLLLSGLVLAIPMTAIAGQRDRDATQIASLETRNSNIGWLQVLSEGKPVARKTRVKHDINRSPVERQLIAFGEDAAPGTVIVDNSDRRLYHVLGNGIAVSYGVSVGRDGFRWTGTEKVSRKAEWPSWNPPEEMRRREAKKGHVLPKQVKGGIDNPLGARALYLGATEFRIHGTNQPASIGQAMSSGCIRMANEDVEYLYAQLTVGTTVIVRD